jgi:hypothetical protein
MVKVVTALIVVVNVVVSVAMIAVMTVVSIETVVAMIRKAKAIVVSAMRSKAQNQKCKIRFSTSLTNLRPHPQLYLLMA